MATYYLYTIYMIPLQHPIYNVVLPIKYLYSSHILATVKISYATCKPCATYILSTWYLYNTYPSHRGVEHCSHILPIYFLPYMLVTHYLAPTHPTRGYPTPNLLHAASVQDHDHQGGGGVCWDGPYMSSCFLLVWETTLIRLISSTMTQ